MPSTVRAEPVAPAATQYRRRCCRSVGCDSRAVGIGSSHRPARRRRAIAVPFNHRTDVGVFDGSLYNRLDLARQLAAPDRRRSRRCCPAGLRALGSRPGEAPERRLRGMHRRCGPTTSGGCTRSARHVPGVLREDVRPILVSTSDSRASRGAGDQPCVQPRSDRDHISHRWNDCHETFFAAIRRLPPGHVLVSSGGSTSVSRYWDPVPDRGPSSGFRPSASKPNSKSASPPPWKTRSRVDKSRFF